MPKMKTHRGAKKRFKVTGTGKIMREKAFGYHKLEHKSSVRTRRLAKDKAARATLQAKRAKEEAVLEEKQKRRIKRAIADRQQKQDHEAKKSKR